MVNKRGEIEGEIFISITLIVLIIYAFMHPDIFKKEESPIINYSTISVASWNLQIFGDTKASNVTLMQNYKNKINDYEIVFIQEIRDEDGSSFRDLCSYLSDYNCKISSRAGRTSSMEQYGLIYKKGLNLISFSDYNPDAQDRWERPPIKVIFNLGLYNLTIFNIHVQPSNAQKELNYLQGITSNEGYIMVLGDLNADCDYYNNNLETEFDTWNWLISDSIDTTVSNSNCAYDRIIVNDNLYTKVKDSGVDNSITKDESDHYLVWVKL